MINVYRQLKLLVLMAIRNIKWLIILCFSGRQKPWDILDFQMYLSARSAGLDLKENSIHKQLILDRIREQESTKIMKRFVQPDDVILDLGANIGYYVLIESTILSQNGYIYAIEPGPENFELLKQNIALNKIENIEVNNIAVSDKEGTARLYIGKACNLHSLVRKPQNSDAEYVEVRTVTVDGFLEDKKPITFLRMDIEGFEATVIRGMTKTLKSPTLKKMFIEIHPMVIDSEQMQDFFKVLQENGFEIEYAVSRDNWQRGVLGQRKVERLNISQLAQDKRVLQKEHAFELFFEKIQ